METVTCQSLRVKGAFLVVEMARKLPLGLRQPFLSLRPLHRAGRWQVSHTLSRLVKMLKHFRASR